MEEINWWLETSQNDWEAFIVLKEKANYPASAFHLHQCAEKALKALCLKHKRPGFTHSCIELCMKLQSYGISIPEEIFKSARRLDPHYIDSRYPNGIGGPPGRFYDIDLIKELEECTRKTRNFVDSQLRI